MSTATLPRAAVRELRDRMLAGMRELLAPLPPALEAELGPAWRCEAAACEVNGLWIAQLRTREGGVVVTEGASLHPWGALRALAWVVRREIERSSWACSPVPVPRTMAVLAALGGDERGLREWQAEEAAA